MNEGRDSTLGLYVSIPFCRSKCTYCNFASGVYPAAEHARYIARVIEDMVDARAWAESAGVQLPRRVDTVYLGGGTPSLLAPELVVRLFGAIRAEFELDPEAEITVECAPGQLADTTLDALAAAGVNRVSLGVQSFIDTEARASGRLHSRAAVLDDLRRLRAAGIANLNIDLIAGLAGQTPVSWEESLAALMETGVPHASVYMLEVDEDSRLGRELLAGGARYHAATVPTEEAITQMYMRAIEELAEAGLAQYEISNFSRPDARSRHNLRYWERRPYLGVGLDASSMLREALPAADSSVRRPGRIGPEPERRCEPGYVLRTTTTDDLKAYLGGPQPVETAWLSPARQHEEAWFLGLRLNAGVEVKTLEQEFGRKLMMRAMDIVERQAENGLISFDGASVRLTPRGRLISNDVFQEFLGLETEELATSAESRP